MGADRVEISKGYAVDAIVGVAAVAEDIFAHLLGVAVGRCGGLAWRLLGHGQGVGLAVDSRARWKEDIGAAVFFHQRAHVHERGEIVHVIFQRFGHRLANSLEGREVNHGVEFVAEEHPAEGLDVASVDLLKGYVASGDLLHAFNSRGLGVGKIVDHDHVVAGFDKGHASVGADISGTPAHEHSLVSCFVHYVRLSNKIVSYDD